MSTKNIKEVDELLTRVVTALNNSDLPTVEDSARLEGLFWDYREAWDNKAIRALGFRTETKYLSNTAGLTPDEFASFVACCVGQLQHSSTPVKEHIQLYLDKKVPIAKLFGERERKQRNDVGWQHQDFMGEFAELVHKEIRRTNKKPLTTRNNGAYGEKSHLYTFLAGLIETDSINDFVSIHEIDDAEIVRKLKNKLENEKQFFTDDSVKALSSTSAWRNAHREFKKSFS